jgi:cell division protein FtsZ
MKLTQAFKKADDVLKTAAKGIAEIITVTGYVNVDFQDVNTVMRDSGKAIMGSGYAEGEDRALRAVEEAVHSPLLDDSDIKGAKNILIYITSGNDEVSLDEVMEITEYVQDATGNCSEVIWGNGEDASLGTGLNVTLIATGFNEKDDKRHVIADNDSDVKVHRMYCDLTGNAPEEPQQIANQNVK